MMLVKNRQQRYANRDQRVDQERSQVAARALQIADLGRGKEMADHKRLTLATDIKVYFCDPQKPLAAWNQ